MVMVVVITFCYPIAFVNKKLIWAMVLLYQRFVSKNHICKKIHLQIAPESKHTRLYALLPLTRAEPLGVTGS